MTVDIAKLRALCDAATPGPWKEYIGAISQLTDGGAGYPLDFYTDSADIVLLKCQECGESAKCSPADVAFIAAARTALPALLDEIERLRTTLAHTREPLLAKALLAEREEAERLRAELAETKLERDDMLGAPRGKEAEELRAGIEKLIENESHDVYELGDVVLRTDIQSLLDRVDARDSLAYLVQCDEIKKLRAQLAAMTAARDELVDWATAFDGRHNVDGGYTSELLPMFTRIGDRERFQRIAELRAVGKERP